MYVNNIHVQAAQASLQTLSFRYAGQADVMAAFGKAVWRLHVSMFSPYEDWAAHQRVEPFSKTEWKNEETSAQGPIMAALLDLCAFFCLWTEAANLRHMPESIWFFYWYAHQNILSLHRPSVETMHGPIVTSAARPYPEAQACVPPRASG